MKNVAHFLRFNSELTFHFDPYNKTYSILAEKTCYAMPYVLTLRLKRYLKGNTSPTPGQIAAWYDSLPRNEKLLINKTIEN